MFSVITPIDVSLEDILINFISNWAQRMRLEWTLWYFSVIFTQRHIKYKYIKFKVHVENFSKQRLKILDS